MAITSIGYGGPVSETQIPTWARALGGLDYGVRDPGSWKVTAAGSGARTVQVAGGGGTGRGITDASTGGEVVQLANPAAGSRWYVVCARRDTQGPGGATTFGYVGDSDPSSAGAVDPTAAINARKTFETTAGTIDEQPLALVRVTRDNPTVQAPIDVRCWQANGGAVGASDYVRGYLNRPGTMLLIDNALWVLRVTPAGAAAWLRLSGGTRRWGANRLSRVNAGSPTDTYGTTMTGLCTLALPADAPPGEYEAKVTYVGGSVSANVAIPHMLRISGPGGSRDIAAHLDGLAMQTVSPTVPFTHTGGAAVFSLSARSESAGRTARVDNRYTMLDVTWIGA